jgi:hypothetical protein
MKKIVFASLMTLLASSVALARHNSVMSDEESISKILLSPEYSRAMNAVVDHLHSPQQIQDLSLDGSTENNVVLTVKYAGGCVAMASASIVEDTEAEKTDGDRIMVLKLTPPQIQVKCN